MRCVVPTVLCLALASPAFAQGPTDATMMNAPSAEAFRRVYPDQARKDGVGANVTLGCAVGADGRLGECEVLQESPSGAGFAEAALALRPGYIFAPATEGGAPVPGRAVLNIDFEPPAAGSKSPFLWLAAITAAIAALGLTVLARRRRKTEG